jgi:glycosyltransferase involved in cell wall biosynthesis
VAEFTSAQERIDPEKFQVIENGIDLEEIERMRISIDVVEIKKTLGLQDSDKVALNVGRLVIQKDQKVLLEGFASFHSKNPNWKLLILGGGLLENDLKQLARELSIERAVIFVGEQRDVHPYYMISDCLISTSKIEGMSNTHLEALAHGLPILSTKTGGTESIVQEGENGYFIPEATEKAVEAALEKFEEADHTRMGERSRKLSHSFDITKTVKRYEELFDVYAR